MSLPKSFPAGTTFSDVEDVPVSVLDFNATAWDSDEPRRFPMDSVLRNGYVISEVEFRELVSGSK